MRKRKHPHKQTHRRKCNKSGLRLQSHTQMPCSKQIEQCSAVREDMRLCLMCVQYVCEKREKHRERLQIRKSVLRLGSIWPGSPGQLGYHVMEKIAIFSSGSLTYLSPLTDTPPPSTPTYPATSLPSSFCVSLYSPISFLRLAVTHS